VSLIYFLLIYLKYSSHFKKIIYKLFFFNSVSLVLPQIRQDLENHVKPNAVCLGSLARSVNFNVIDDIANECAPRFTYIYRVKVDYYWQSSLFEVVNRLNQMNLKRYLNR
jgi:hypothetical protein